MIIIYMRHAASYWEPSRTIASLRGGLAGSRCTSLLACTMCMCICCPPRSRAVTHPQPRPWRLRKPRDASCLCTRGRKPSAGLSVVSSSVPAATVFIPPSMFEGDTHCQQWAGQAKGPKPGGTQSSPLASQPHPGPQPCMPPQGRRPPAEDRASPRRARDIPTVVHHRSADADDGAAAALRQKGRGQLQDVKLHR